MHAVVLQDGTERVTALPAPYAGVTAGINFVVSHSPNVSRLTCLNTKRIGAIWGEGHAKK